MSHNECPTQSDQKDNGRDESYNGNGFNHVRYTNARLCADNKCKNDMHSYTLTCTIHT